MINCVTWETSHLFGDALVSQHRLRHLPEAQGAGLKAGLSIPLHGPMGATCAIALASESDDAQANKNTLQAMAVQFHTVYTGLHPELHQRPEQVRLTPRERECLQWCANGKSSWEIGMILSISEHGVSFHLKNAMAKLDVTSRIAAVVKAIRLGLIVL